MAGAALPLMGPPARGGTDNPGVPTVAPKARTSQAEGAHARAC